VDEMVEADWRRRHAIVPRGTNQVQLGE